MAVSAAPSGKRLLLSPSVPGELLASQLQCSETRTPSHAYLRSAARHLRLHCVFLGVIDPLTAVLKSGRTRSDLVLLHAGKRVGSHPTPNAKPGLVSDWLTWISAAIGTCFVDLQAICT